MTNEMPTTRRKRRMMWHEVIVISASVITTLSVLGGGILVAAHTSFTTEHNTQTIEALSDTAKSQARAIQILEDQNQFNKQQFKAMSHQFERLNAKLDTIEYQQRHHENEASADP